MANVMEVIASAIAAGVLTDAESVREETRAKNREAIGTLNAIVWMDAAMWIGSKVEEYDAKGLLRTVDDYGTAWSAIAKGLRAAGSPQLPKAPPLPPLPPEQPWTVSPPLPAKAPIL